MDIQLLILTILAGTGVTAVIAILISLFTSFGYRKKSLEVTEEATVTDDSFLQAVAGAVNRPVQYGGAIEIIETGDAFMDRLLADIAAAKHTITLTTYLWRHGKMSGALTDALLARAKEGIEIRILLDSQGAPLFTDAHLQRLTEAGVPVVFFRPLRFGHLTRWHRRTHRRAFVIDGAIAYTGGIALVDTWLGDGTQPRHWRDLMFRTTGSYVAPLQSAFAELWNAATGEFLVGDTWYGPLTFNSLTDATPSPFIAIASSPSLQTQPLDKLMWLTIHAAKKHLIIASPFLTPYIHVRKELIARAKAGVRVQILLPGTLDVWFVRRAGMAHYEELLEAGVELYEYQPALFHSKFVVVDGSWSIIGSANLDIRSMRLNEENVIGIRDTDFAAQLEDIFTRDLKRSKRIELAEWRQRSWWQRIIDKSLVLFEEQF